MKLRTSWRALLLSPLALPFAALLAPAPTAFAAPTASVGHIMSPAGRIVYQMTSTGGQGTGRSGTINMTWANHGTQFRQDIQMNMGRAGSRVDPMTIWVIFDGRAAYVGLPAGATGTKMALKMAPNAEQLKRFSGGNLMNMNATSGKIVGKATVLGKPCEIRLMSATTTQGTSQTKIWAWQGLPLRTEIQGKSKDGATTTTTLVATKLDTDLKPAASMFKVPAGYTVQDMSALLGKMAGALGKPQ